MAIRMKPGEPQIPVYGSLFGISSLDNVSLQILDAEYETLRGYRIPPAPPFPVNKDHYLDVQGDASTENYPNPPANERDERLYARDAFYPGVLAEVGHTGHLRDQPVAQAQWYPLQYNPVTGDVRFYRRIRARITWNSPLRQKRHRRAIKVPHFENLLKNVLVNYRELNRVDADAINNLRKHPRGNNASTPNVDNALSPHSFETGTNIPLDDEGQKASSKNNPALKIGITEDGIYKITYRDLVKAGWNVSSIDPRNIIMQHWEKEVPIIVSGEADGVFHPKDYLLFYGVSNKDIYTTKNVYWLKSGNKNGMRMATKNGTISGNNVVPDGFPALFHAEEDSNYWQTIPLWLG